MLKTTRLEATEHKAESLIDHKRFFFEIHFFSDLEHWYRYFKKAKTTHK